MLKSKLLTLLALFALGFAFAEEAEIEDDYVWDTPGSSSGDSSSSRRPSYNDDEYESEQRMPMNPDTPNIEVAWSLPDNPFQMVVNGDIVKILVLFKNAGLAPLRITGLQGRFTQPRNYQDIIQNMTQSQYYADVAPGQETTILYRFRTDFPPGVIGFVLDVDFADLKKELGYRSRAVEVELTISEAVVDFMDPGNIFIYAVLSGSVVVGLYIVYVAFLSKVPVNDKKKPKKEFSSDWIPEFHLKSDEKMVKKRPHSNPHKNHSELTSVN